MRLGLVGCGRVAERGYLPALRLTSEVELVAVADHDPARCRVAAPGVPAYRDVEALLGGTHVDVVVVATPARDHLGVASAAARAEVRALVEKPPAPSAAEAAALALLRPEPWIGFNRRFEPRLAALRSEALRHDGPLELELELSIDRRVWAAHGGSEDLVLDLGPHVVDLASWLTGRRVEQVRASRIRPDAVSLDLALERGSVHAAIAHDRPWAESVALRDGGGSVGGRFAAGGRTGRVLARLGLARAATFVELLAAQLDAVARAIRTGEAPAALATAEEAARVMAVLEAAYTSLDTGGEWVPCSR